jgi:hypothetical protein
MSVRMPGQSRLSTSMPCDQAKKGRITRAFSSDPSFQRNWPCSPVADETAAYTSASHRTKRHRINPSKTLDSSESMYCQYTEGRNSLTTRPVKAVPLGGSMLSSSTASGRGEPEEGSRRRMRVSCRGACQVPNLTAGFRRRALFRETLAAN